MPVSECVIVLFACTFAHVDVARQTPTSFNGPSSTSRLAFSALRLPQKPQPKRNFSPNELRALLALARELVA